MEVLKLVKLTYVERAVPFAYIEVEEAVKIIDGHGQRVRFGVILDTCRGGGGR